MTSFEDAVREKASEYLHLVEALMYMLIGALLSIAAAGGVLQTGMLLWRAAIERTTANYGFGLLVLDHLLLVLMLVELLHTVRISVRSQTLIMEPFLIVGLIASIRRVLVITMQAAKMTEQGEAPAGQSGNVAFQNAMVELGVLGFLTLAFVVAIYLLRRRTPQEEALVQ